MLPLQDHHEHVVLDPKHPGINDAMYRTRRDLFHRVSREHRLAGEAMPTFEYSAEEQRVWRWVLTHLETAHAAHACSIYQTAKDVLGIGAETIPAPRHIDNTLRSLTDFQLAPAEGLLNVEDFFGSLARRRFPCTQYLRHGADPSFTPEPDMVHDLVGHVPLLVDSDYAGLIETMGQLSRGAPTSELSMLGQFYWFGIEFGLIEENGALKAFGSGLLSSYGEMEHAHSSNTAKRPFELDDVLRTPYDPTAMQELLFVIPSFAFLRAELERLSERMDGESKVRAGGRAGQPKCKAATG